MIHAFRVVAAGCALLVGAALPADASEGDSPVYQKPVSAKLNSTGRTISMPLPLRDEGRELGDIVVRIAPDDTISVPVATLTATLAGALDKAALSRIARLETADGFAGLRQLAAIGITLTFDPGQLALTLVPKADQRPEGDISLAGRAPIRQSAAAAQPALVSGYLNVLAGIDHRWAGASGREATSSRFEFETVFSFWNIVAENDFHIDGVVDTFTCPAGAVCSYTHAEGLKRRRSRFVYDMPEEQLRLQVGDADVNGTGLQRTNDVLGFTLEKSPRKLSPGENIRAVGRSSLRLERASDIEVLVNGAVVQKLRLRAGVYNLSDLPLGTGANDVELRITDDAGTVTTRAYTAFFDANLLGAGKSEWSMSAGIPSYFRDDARAYRSQDFVATGFYRQGLTGEVTAEAHVQADMQVVMGGAGVFAMLPWGIAGVQGAMSSSATGQGFAVSVNFDRSNTAGLFSRYTGLREHLHLGAEYRSPEFRTPGEYIVTATGVVFPDQPYSLRLSASYMVPLPHNITASLAGRYQFADPDATQLTAYSIKSDRYGADLTLSKPLSPMTTGSISVGYSNETVRPDIVATDDRADFRVMARLFWRPAANTTVSAAADSLNRETSVSAFQTVGQGLDRWEASVNAQNNQRDGRSSGGVNAAYYGNRFEARVSHDGSLDERQPSLKGSLAADQRTSVTAGASIAFADGAFAVGAPIRGQGFAIVEAHETLAGRKVTVGPDGYELARSDALGPALVTDLPAYATRTLPVDAENLPLGYSLGQGAFETVAPYRGGYRITVGSNYSVTAFGTLLARNGEPLTLVSGVAYQKGHPDKQVAVFTNNSGRFGADGLAPGTWIIKMATENEAAKYTIEIPPKTDGLFRAGTLSPMEAQQ